MRYLLASLALWFTACATEARPPTLDYIVVAILAPTCGRAACHSTTARAHDLVFDTIGGTIASLQTSTRNGPLVVPGSPSESLLVNVLSDPSRIMPPDAPLPQADIDLITSWVASGAMETP